MYTIRNFVDNEDVKILDKKGPFTVLEHMRDLSVAPEYAETAYYCSRMNVRKRQLMCEVGMSGITIQAGTMQWMAGNNVNVTTGIKGVGDFLAKTGKKDEVANSIKSEYIGQGTLVLAPTYRHLLLLDVGEWDNAIVLDDSQFLACESQLKHKAAMRSSASSAEALFNLRLDGQGIVCIVSDCPEEELIVAELDKDVLKIDGNYALAWSHTLQFTVERSDKTLSGETEHIGRRVNVFRGSGKVLMMPTARIIYK